VIDRVRALVDEGYREIVLTGVDVTSYGADLPGSPSLGSLVERILAQVPALPRLRLSSIDSVEIDERLFALLTDEPRVMPHVHLSLQSGDDMILKRMKRRHTRADAIRIVERLLVARPEISIGADIIAGFPTETEEMFANSLALVEECRIVHGHIFPYSPPHGNARRADAAGRPRNGQGPRRRLAQSVRRQPRALARLAGRLAPAGAGRKRRNIGPFREFCPRAPAHPQKTRRNRRCDHRRG
jgi:threonylcarbamoyladenosine tRNA methylthiotransferase MtaB